MKLHVSILTIGLAMGMIGCAGRPALIPVSDPDLKKTSAEFAADAAKRSYKPEAARGGDAQAQAEVNHGMFNRIEAINLSEENWNNVELWVNGQYVVHLANWPAKQLKKVNFQMLFDNNGKSFPIDNKTVRVQKIEVERDGKFYNVPMVLAD
jgi:hypothetical protein